MAYLTHGEYTQMGGSLDETAFTVQEYRARKLIDRLTHGRVKNDDPQREAVKHAMFEVIERLSSMSEHEDREVQSMSNDGVSVTYATNGDGSALSRCVGVVRKYLSDEVSAEGVPLMYAGVYE